MRGCQQLIQFDEWRRRPPARLDGPLKNGGFVLKAKSADPACVIDSQEKIECVQRLGLDIDARASCFLSGFGVVAQDHAPCPTVRLGVCDRAVEEGASLLTSMKLRTIYQGKGGIDREAVGFSEPLGTIFEGGILS